MTTFISNMKVICKTGYEDFSGFSAQGCVIERTTR
jgi:hypothetical protein